MAKKFIVETSARHVHLTDADLETLFGKGAKLTPKKDLSQPGQFACEERVDLVGPKKTIARVSVLGPTRSHTQVEIPSPMQELWAFPLLFVSPVILLEAAQSLWLALLDRLSCLRVLSLQNVTSMLTLLPLLRWA